MERTALLRRLRDRRIKKEEFDLERYYVTKPGPWLSAPASAEGAPDVLLVLLGQRLRPGRSSLVQWNEEGVARGGFTFVVRGKEGAGT